jgi:hypothetical protein
VDHRNLGIEVHTSEPATFNEWLDRRQVWSGGPETFREWLAAKRAAADPQKLAAIQATYPPDIAAKYPLPPLPSEPTFATVDPDMALMARLGLDPKDEADMRACGLTVSDIKAEPPGSPWDGSGEWQRCRALQFRLYDAAMGRPNRQPPHPAPPASTTASTKPDRTEELLKKMAGGAKLSRAEIDELSAGTADWLKTCPVDACGIFADTLTMYRSGVVPACDSALSVGTIKTLLGQKNPLLGMFADSFATKVLELKDAVELSSSAEGRSCSLIALTGSGRLRVNYSMEWLKDRSDIYTSIQSATPEAFKPL